MLEIPGVYVEFKGDLTELKRDFNKAKALASEAGTGISNGLKNAVLPNTITESFNYLYQDLTKISRAAALTEADFKKLGISLDKDLRKNVGMTEEGFLKLQQRMLQNKATQQAERAIKRIGKAANLTSLEMAKLHMKVGDQAGAFRRFGVSIDKDVLKKLNLTEKELTQLHHRMAETSATKRARQSLEQLGRAAGMSARQLAKLQHRAGDHVGAMRTLRRSTAQTTAALGGLAMKAGLVTAAAAAVVYPVARMSKAIWEAGRATKVAENAYKSITGSTAAARVEFDFLRKTAEELGLSYYDLRDGYTGFLAAAKDSKIPMEETRKIFHSVSRAASILGLSSERVKYTFMALEQMMSKGKVSMEELRRQMGDNLYGAFQKAAKAMGWTTEQLDEVISQGKLFSHEFLPKFRKELDKTEGTVDDTVRAENRMKDAWIDLKNEMADSGFMDDVADALGDIATTLKDPKVQEGLSFMAKMLGFIISTGAKIPKLFVPHENQRWLSRAHDFESRNQGKSLIDIPKVEIQSLADVWNEQAKRMRDAANELIEISEMENQSLAEIWNEKAEAIKDIASEPIKLPEIENLSLADSWKSEIVAIEDIANEFMDRVRKKEEETARTAAAKVLEFETQTQKEIRKKYEKSLEYQIKTKKEGLSAYKKYGGKRLDVIKHHENEIKKIERQKADLAAKAASKAIEAKRKKAKVVEDYITQTKRLTMKRFDLEKWQLEKWYKDQEAAYGKSLELKELYEAKKSDIAKRRVQEEYETLKKRLDKEAAEYDKRVKETQDAYDDMFSTIQDHVYNFIDDWENAGDILVDIAKKTAKEIVAAFITQKIVMPIALQVGSQMGLNWGSMPMQAMMGQGGQGIPGMTGNPVQMLGQVGKLPGMGFVSDALSWNLPGTGHVFSTSLPGAGPVEMIVDKVPLSQALGAGFMGSMGYSMLADPLGLPTSKYSSLTAGLGGSLMGAYGGTMSTALAGTAFGSTAVGEMMAGAIAGPVGIALGALLGGVLGGKLGHEDTPEFGIRNSGRGRGNIEEIWAVNEKDRIRSKYRYSPFVQDMGDKEPLAKEVHKYFEQRFAVLDDAIDISLADVVDSRRFDIRASAGELKEWGLPKTLQYLSNRFVGEYKDILIDEVTKQHGLDSATFNEDFFKSIAPDDDMIAAFARFDAVMDETAGASQELTRRIEEHGMSAVEAFNQMSAMSGILKKMDADIAAMGKDSALASINAMTAAWNAQIDAMKKANATLEQVTKAEESRNFVLGANITGVNVNSIAQALQSGTDVGQIMAQTLGDLLNRQMAEQMFDQMRPALEEAGRVWQETGGDIEAVKQSLIDAGYALDSLSTSARSIVDSAQYIAERQSIQMRMYRAMGNDRAAIAIQRKSELAKLHSSYGDAAAPLEQMLKRTWHAEDLVAAKERRNRAAQAYLSALQRQQSAAAAQANQARSNQLKGLNDSLSKQRQAVSQLSSAIERIGKYRDGLWTGSDSPLDTATRQELLAEKIDSLRTQSLAGDTKAMGELPGTIREYLALSKTTASDWVAYAKDVAAMDAVLEDIESHGEESLDQAEREIRRLESIINGLDGVRQTVADFSTSSLSFDSSWYQAEIDKLEAILNSSKSLEDLMADFNNAQSEYENAQGNQNNGEDFKQKQENRYVESIIAWAKHNGQPHWTDPSAIRAEFEKFGGYLNHWAAKHDESGINLLQQGESLDSAFGKHQESQYVLDIIKWAHQNGQPQWYDPAAIREEFKNFGGYLGHWTAKHGESGINLLPKYADGGISSGPMSGYPVELHGVEAIMPLGNGALPLEITKMPMPILPDYGASDGYLLEAIKDLQEEVRRLREDQKILNEQIAANTAQSAHYAESEYRRKGRDENTDEEEAA